MLITGLELQEVQHVWLIRALAAQDQDAARLRALAARHLPDCLDGRGALGPWAGLELALQSCLKWHRRRSLPCRIKRQIRLACCLAQLNKEQLSIWQST